MFYKTWKKRYESPFGPRALEASNLKIAALIFSIAGVAKKKMLSFKDTEEGMTSYQIFL